MFVGTFEVHQVTDDLKDTVLVSYDPEHNHHLSDQQSITSSLFSAYTHLNNSKE